MKRIAPIFVAALAAFGLSACSASPYAAKVDGVTIKPSTIQDELHAITSNAAYADAINNQLASTGGLRPGGPNTINAQYAASLLYDQVLAVLIDKELRTNNITVTEEQRKATLDKIRGGSSDPTQFDSLATSYKDYIVGSQAGLQALLDSRSTPAAQQKYYNDNIKKYTDVCIRQMTIADEATGTAIKGQLAAGGDFATLAQQASAAAGVTYDPSLAEPQCISEDQLSAYAASILDPLGPGAVSDPLQVSGGFALVQVTTRTAKPFADVQGEITTALTDQDALFSDLLAKASIKVNPKYGEFHPADTSNNTPAGISPKTAVALSEGASSSTKSADDGSTGGSTDVDASGGAATPAQ